LTVRGSAATVNLVDLLGLLQSSGHAGTLRLRIGERHHRLHFLRGKIYLPTGGSRGAYRIGALLVRAGKLSGKDLLRALQAQKAHGHRERLGDLLVRTKLVSRGDLDEVIREKFEEEICDLLFEEGAEYEFKKNVLPAGFTDAQGNINALGFDIRSILMEATRRQDEWRQIRKVLPSGRAIYRLNTTEAGTWSVDNSTGQFRGSTRRTKSDDPRAEIMGRWREAHALFEEVPFDGAKSLDEIVAASGVTAFGAMGVTAGLLTDGLIRELAPREVETYILKLLKEGRTRQAYKLFEWANESDRLRAVASKLDKFLLRKEYLGDLTFQSRTASVRALQILSRLLRRGAAFRFLARESESQVEVYYHSGALRLHLSGPRRTHSTTRYLRRRRSLSSKSLARARQTAKLERRNLDRVLLEDGFVGRDQWIRAVKDKVVSGLFSIFGWSEPYVEVQGGVVPPPAPEEVDGMVCEFPLTGQLREDLRKDLLRWKVLLKWIPTPNVLFLCVRPTPGNQPRRAHDLFDGRRTVGDLIQLARVAPLELVRFVYDSIQSGKIRQLSDREHYERIEEARQQGRYDEAVAACKSAIAWGYAPTLYEQRLKELRQLLQDRPNTELRPVIQGDTSTFSMAEVLQLLHQGKRTGTLKIRELGDETEREQVFYLDEGDLYVLKVEQATSDQEVWDLLMGDETRSSLNLRELLKRNGLVEQADLSADELAAIKDDIFETFLWEGAEFEFVQNLLPSELRQDTERATKVKLNTGMFLMEAMGRLAEWDELREVLKSERAVWRYSSPAAQLEAVRQGMGATAYLYDGKHSLADVSRIAGGKRLKVFRQAKELVEQGALELVGVKQRPGAGRKTRRQALASGRLPTLQSRRSLEAEASRFPAHMLNSDLEIPSELGDSMDG
jgi:hypothetical protein